MTGMTDSIVVKRLLRNLQYRQTYTRVFETFLEQRPGPFLFVELLKSLVTAQQSAILSLTSYLEGLGAGANGLWLKQRLLEQASDRRSFKSRLRFVHYGLERSVSWYKIQLTDTQMTSDPALEDLLFEIGEREGALLWRTEATMAILGVPLAVDQKDSEDQVQPSQKTPRGRRPSWDDKAQRAAWARQGSRRWPKGPRRDRR